MLGRSCTTARGGRGLSVGRGRHHRRSAPLDLRTAGSCSTTSAGIAATTSSARQPRSCPYRRRVPTCRVGQWQGNDCFHDQFFPGDRPTYFTPRSPRLASDRYRHLRQARQRRRRGRAVDRTARVVPHRAREGPGTTDARIRAPSARRRAVAVPDLAGNPSTPPRRRPSCRTTRAFPACSCTMPDTRIATSARSARCTRGHAAGGVGRQGISGGFALLRLHTGGFALNFYKSRSRLARSGANAAARRSPGCGPSSHSAVGRRPQPRTRPRPVEHSTPSILLLATDAWGELERLSTHAYTYACAWCPARRAPS